ncbi:hypothetical protein [Ligilactobacillus sp. Marseille-Q7487]|jgi:hypothetical protein|uniref:hypothetical protein n=1 Tax=Ligilactobacillus sp. Marseille-Q7487 TaxID=3022128 RepID=UPI0015B591E4|nr:hypothetical protein [Ligilactobacillus sp. Marseille-Q7487]
MDIIRYFRLKNKGAFVAKMDVICSIESGENSAKIVCHQDGYRDICAAGERSIDISELRYTDSNGNKQPIPEGSIVQLKVVVVAGKDKTSEEYVYSSKSEAMQSFKIKGTTLINSLEKIGNNE